MEREERCELCNRCKELDYWVYKEDGHIDHKEIGHVCTLLASEGSCLKLDDINSTCECFSDVDMDSRKVELLNNLVKSATYFGGDPGGPYCIPSELDGLLDNIKKMIYMLELVGKVDINIDKEIPYLTLKPAEEEEPESEKYI